MSSPFPAEYKAIADGMGISLYQRFTPQEASLFLRCPLQDIKTLIRSGKVNCIQITEKQFEFFGYQLLEYLMGSVTQHSIETAPLAPNQPNRILRTKEVQEMTGISRTTLWRLESKGDFPRRVSLGVGSVGWHESEVKRWIKDRETL